MKVEPTRPFLGTRAEMWGTLLKSQEKVSSFFLQFLFQPMVFLFCYFMLYFLKHRVFIERVQMLTDAWGFALKLGTQGTGNQSQPSSRLHSGSSGAEGGGGC